MDDFRPDLTDLDLSLDLSEPENPLDTLVEYQQNIEHDAVAEVNAIAEQFRRKDRAERARLKKIFDSEYHLTLCFTTREQKEDFLAKSGWGAWGRDKYLDGRRVARALGIELLDDACPNQKPRISKAWGEFVDGTNLAPVPKQ